MTRIRFQGWGAVLATGGLPFVLVLGAAQPGRAERYCSDTALLQFDACRHEVQDDLGTARAICLNEGERGDREECRREARAEAAEARRLCDAQLAARRALCREMGEARYDPDLEPGDFAPDFVAAAHVNPWFPLRVGDRWEFAGGDETVVIEVTPRTKLIDDVVCIEVNDRVEIAGRVVEDTDDWFAQELDGDVWYFGEEVKDFEFFAGDVPPRPELVSIDGSFKAGREGAEPGLAFLGAPAAGRVYRQEFALGNAEDAARVLSTTYRRGASPELDELVPAALADLLCGAGDCVVTGEFAATEPDSFARKYYARGVGKFLEVNPAKREVVQLVGCNVAPVCGMLPVP